MAIPEINEAQATALTEMVQGLGAVSMPVPDATLDSYAKYNSLQDELCDLNQLVILGLLKDITSDCGDKLATMYSMSNRHFRIFEVTQISRYMFDGTERKVQ